MYLFWSQPINTTNLSFFLKILKNIAVYSSILFEAKTSNPKGPTPVLANEPLWLAISCGFVQFDSSTSACSSTAIGIEKEISTSACRIMSVKLASCFEFGRIISTKEIDKLLHRKNYTCAAVTPQISRFKPASSVIFCKSTLFVLSISISSTGH